MILKIAHISDLHFSRFSWGISQFFSKRWIGNINLIFNRARTHLNPLPFTLIDTFIHHGITHVFITGDLSTTSSKKEFEIGKTFIDKLQKAGMLVYCIPGNHDSYTKSAYKKGLFYTCLPESHPSLEGWDLQKDKVAATYLQPHLWLVRLDCTHPAPIHYSTGLYTQKQNSCLRELLSTIPPQDTVIMMNHFPLFHHEHPRRVLQGAELLRKTLSSFPCVKLYLHGHTHRHSLADLRGNHLPIVVDSGSASHARRGSWNLLELRHEKLSISFFKAYERAYWNLEKTLSYRL